MVSFIAPLLRTAASEKNRVAQLSSRVFVDKEGKTRSGSGNQAGGVDDGVVRSSLTRGDRIASHQQNVSVWQSCAGMTIYWLLQLSNDGIALLSGDEELHFMMALVTSHNDYAACISLLYVYKF